MAHQKFGSDEAPKGVRPATGVQASRSRQEPPTDPLTEEQAKLLLTRVDVIRDPLHGDIRLTALERFLVDSPDFQRLRNVNQLAMTYMAYPGALHTRFLHSLGVLHVCSQMIDTCNANAENYVRLAGPDHPLPVRINSYGLLLARLCALLHDLAHVPFGHTLEKEGRIFQTDEWQDKGRLDRLLGDNSRVARYIRRFFERAELPPAAALSLLSDIRIVLGARARDVRNLPYPFVHDLVGNTICADLIDYVQRDMYFCGLTETLAKRFMEYLAIMPVRDTRGEDEAEPRPLVPIRHHNSTIFRRTPAPNGAIMCRLVLLQYRYNERQTFVRKHDVIAEAIDLVRRRLTVAEKLYFHRTKMVASSMLIAAAHDARLTPEQIWDLSDSEVLKLLEHSTSHRASRIATKLRTRRLFKPIFRATYVEPDESSRSYALWDPERGAYARFQRPEGREALATRLERIIGVAKRGDPDAGYGTVAISCPDRDMNLKAFDMLVLPMPKAQIARLQDSDYRPTAKEIDAIQDTHKHLWRLEVFIDTDVVAFDLGDSFVRKLAGAIQQEIGLENESATFGRLPSFDLQELETEVVLSHELTKLGALNEIKLADFQELKAMRFRDQLPLEDQVREFLRSKGYKVR